MARKDLLDRLIADVETQRDRAHEGRAFTAIATLTKQLVALQRERGQLEDAEPIGDPTPEAVRSEIMALPDHLVPAAKAAVRERERLGRR